MDRIGIKFTFLLLLFSLLWPRQIRSMELKESEFFNRNPALLDLSTLSLEVNKTVKKPLRPYLGAFGIGGLDAFTVLGLAYPFNTYHNTTTYYHPFFADSWVGIEMDGKDIVFPNDSIWYARGASIAVTREQDNRLAMLTVNFSPPKSGAFVRIVVLKALEDMKNLKLFADIYGDKETKDKELIQTRGSGGQTRKLVIGSLDGLGGIENQRLAIEIPILARGEEKVFYFYNVILNGDNPPQPVLARLKADKEKLLSETMAFWKDYLDGSTRITTPDLRLNDMLENLKIAQKIQRNANGAQVCVVKYADRSHDRENIQVTRYYLLMGMPDDAREIMLYNYYAAWKIGIILNSQDASLDITHLPETVDWEHITMDNDNPDQHPAERPSWTILQFYRYYKAAGDLELIRKVYPYLKRNILGQEITPEGLLPFHGDEMYQITYPMNISKTQLKDFHSLDSSFAFIMASSGMEEIAEKLGFADDKAKFAGLRERVEAAVDKYYWLPEGYYATGLRKDDLSPLVKMFPLIGLNPVTIGFGGKDDKMYQNLLKNIERLSQKDGTLKMAAGASLYHGQLPGEFLFNLKYFLHPLGEKIFNLLIHKISDPAGMFSEVQANNHSHFFVSADPSGKGKEDARRFGPWESALNISSLVYYLTGLSVDADKMQVKLVPVMPRDWDQWRMIDGKVKQNRFDLFVRDNGNEINYRFENKGPEPLSVSLTLPLGPRIPDSVAVNGEKMSLSDLTIKTFSEQTVIQIIRPRVEKELVVQVQYH